MVRGTGKYTVVTGASSGIGYETAKAFAGRGKNLVITARRREHLEMLRKEIWEKYPDLDVVVRSLDLSIPENAHQLYEGLKGYEIETWVNNAGFGNYDSVAHQDLQKIGTMLHLDIEALTILSTLFVRDYRDTKGTQLINVSSAGGYTMVPAAVTYCAAKFYVSAFTEGLAWELKETGAKMKVKALAPAATRTEFGMVANNVREYDYDKSFGRCHTSSQMAGFLLELYDSEKVVGIVDRESFSSGWLTRYFHMRVVLHIIRNAYENMKLPLVRFMQSNQPFTQQVSEIPAFFPIRLLRAGSGLWKR